MARRFLSASLRKDLAKFRFRNVTLHTALASPHFLIPAQLVGDRCLQCAAVQSDHIKHHIRNSQIKLQYQRVLH